MRTIKINGKPVLVYKYKNVVSASNQLVFVMEPKPHTEEVQGQRFNHTTFILEQSRLSLLWPHVGEPDAKEPEIIIGIDGLEQKMDGKQKATLTTSYGIPWIAFCSYHDLTLEERTLVFQERQLEALQSKPTVEPKASKNLSDYLSVKGAAKAARVTERTIRQWMHDDWLKFERNGRKISIQQKDVEKCAQSAKKPVKKKIM